jgi:16S rRNA (cytosine967-C5)-methyltransferase
MYVTCSILPEENEDTIASFLATNPTFAPVNPTTLVSDAGLSGLLAHCHKAGPGLQMTPLATGTDGFFICGLQRAG